MARGGGGGGGEVKEDGTFVIFSRIIVVIASVILFVSLVSLLMQTRTDMRIILDVCCVCILFFYTTPFLFCFNAVSEL